MSTDEADLRHVSFGGKPAAPRPYGEPSWQARRQGATAAGRCVSPAPTLAPAGVDPGALARWVLDRAGLDTGAYRPESLRRRIPACVRALKARSGHEAQQRLTERPDLLGRAVSSLLIGVTGFFRDPEVFEALRSAVLPALAERDRPLRVWSAGCAWGAELYSFAILLSQAGLLDRAYLLGTDCRPDAIEEAEDATFKIDQARTLGERVLRKSFKPSADGTARPIEALRRRMQWKVADFLRTAERGPWDVIFWRNAAIYLNPGPAALAGERLIAQLAPGGFLVLGKAERPPERSQLRLVHRCIYTCSSRA